jgi:alginate O-acetyltransferase complex protein AlgI
MLFNEPVFILIFLPVVLCVFFLLGKAGKTEWAVGWLVAASLFFYAWWRIDFLPLLLISIGVNFGFGLALARWPSRLLLGIGIAANLLALGWFKYAGFMAQAINDLAGIGLPVPQIVLPLAISFYTFQQIAYLIDAQSGEARETSLLRYALFVVFFPQLIAGPIVHHREMLDQFKLAETFKPRLNNLILGMSAFSIGLFKKVVLADPLGGVSSVAFAPAAEGLAPAFADAWIGAVAFSLQLYFDFSGYSDMAVGLGLMFGIKLPVNFLSPFKAASIIDFWARWHMTLTRFLTAYVYNPVVLSITRHRVAKGKPLLRRTKPALGPFIMLLAIPTVITMGLAGVWHGAGWQYVVFGLLHAALLVGNHAWRALRQTLKINLGLGWLGHGLAVLATFLAVTVTFVFFKATSLEHALTVVRGMFGMGGEATLMATIGGRDPNEMGAVELLLWRVASLQGALIVGGLAICWLLPNTARYLELITGTMADENKRAPLPRPNPAQPLIFRFGSVALLKPRAGFLEGSILGALLALALLRVISAAPSEFLYFTF